MWALFPSIVIGALLLIVLTLLGQVYGYSTLIYSAVVVLVIYIIYLIFVIKEFRVNPPLAPKVIEKPIVKKVETIKEVIKPDIEEEDFIILKDYIKYNFYYGHKKEAIVEKLLSAGWKKEKIDQALNELGEITPVKNKKAVEKKISVLSKQIENIKK